MDRLVVEFYVPGIEGSETSQASPPPLLPRGKGATVFVQPGDTIISLAIRHLGDPSRWTEIAKLNELDYPYIAEDPAPYRLQGLRVLGPYDPVRIPVALEEVPTAVEPYGVDLAWRPSTLNLIWNGAGFELDRGLVNLAYALYRRIITYPGELPAHPDYGCRLRDHLGQSITQARIQLMAVELKKTLLADPRVREADVGGIYDASTGEVRLEARVEPIPPSEALVLNVRVGGG